MNNNMKIARERLGLTQDEAALELGIPLKTYRNYEQGVREPNGATLVKIARLYNTTVDYLLARDDDPTPNDIRWAAKTTNGISLDDLTEDDIDQVNRFVEFLRQQRKTDEDGNN